jgi:two-component system sensor histidine kinase AlgZ
MPPLVQEKAPDKDFFLPDFCGVHALFVVLVLTEIFAIILTLAHPTHGLALWEQLALVSLFMQFIGLGGAAMLCLNSRWLRRLDNRRAALWAWFLLLVAMLVVLELSWRMVWLPILRAEPGAHLYFIARNLAIGAIIGALMLRYFYLTHQSRRRLLAESEARLAALQARIRPHFLFNSLNSIASLTRSDARQAEAAIEDLADLFRSSLGDGRRLIPLAEELELSRRYLNMEALRLGRRLCVKWTIEALPVDALIPPLCLQPLLENAVYHGIEQRIDGGCIEIAGARAGTQLSLTVSNPCAENAPPHSGNRIALDNVRQRLAFHFGRAAGLDARPLDDGFQVRLYFPERREPPRAHPDR